MSLEVHKSNVCFDLSVRVPEGTPYREIERLLKRRATLVIRTAYFLDRLFAPLDRLRGGTP